MNRYLSAILVLASLCLWGQAWGQGVPSGGGLGVPSNAPGVSLSGGSTIQPAYAGVGLLSNAFCLSAPASIFASINCFGYGASGPEGGEFDMTGADARNVAAIMSYNVNGFSALTFRGTDPFYTNYTLTCTPVINNPSMTCTTNTPTVPTGTTGLTVSGTGIAGGAVVSGGFGTATVTINPAPTSSPGAVSVLFAPLLEKGAIGWGNNFSTFFIEASTYDGTSNALYPPASFLIMQTGGVDNSGGSNVTCTPVSGNTSMSCSSNGGANGTLVTGAGIPPATTVSSGGGTTTIVLTKAPTSSPGAETVNFGSPTYSQHYTMKFQQTGNIDFYNWDGTENLGLDRINKRVGVLTAAPQFAFDVNGSSRVGGSLLLGQSAFSQASWTTSGIGIAASGGPYTDTTATGTVANESIHALAAPTLNATNAGVTVTNLNTLYIVAPTAGTNVTATNLWALNVNGRSSLGFFQSGGGANIFGGAFTVNVNSNFATNINTGTTTSTLTLGGSSNETDLLSATIKATNLPTDATHTDRSVCEDTTSFQLYYGSGTLGICLGTSSARYKHDIAPLDAGLAQITALKPVKYKLNADHGDPNKLLYGFTAEQGSEVLPALSDKDAEGRPNTFDYIGVVPVLVKAVQELKADNDNLREVITHKIRK